MFAKTLFKNPIFTLGILLMSIFLYQLVDSDKFALFKREKLTPTSCSAVLANLTKRIPASWTAECKLGVLRVQMTLETQENIHEEELKRALVSEMANNLYLIAKYAPAENLERMPYLVVKLSAGNLEMNARTQGEQLLRLATLTNQKLIAEHLKATVETQIVTK